MKENISLLVIVVALLLNSCLSFEDSNECNEHLAVQISANNIKTLQRINEGLIEEMLYYDKITGDGGMPSYVYDFDASQLETNYIEALIFYANLQDDILTNIELSENLSKNYEHTLASLLTPMGDESFSILTMLESIDEQNLDKVKHMSDSEEELNQCYLGTMLFYNELFRIGLRYLKEVEIGRDFKYPVVRRIAGNNKDVLEIYVASWANNLSEDYRLKVDGVMTSFSDGKVIIDLAQYQKDTIPISLEVESKIDGSVFASETYYLNE